MESNLLQEPYCYLAEGQPRAAQQWASSSPCKPWGHGKDFPTVRADKQEGLNTSGRALHHGWPLARGSPAGRAGRRVFPQKDEVSRAECGGTLSFRDELCCLQGFIGREHW